MPVANAVPNLIPIDFQSMQDKVYDRIRDTLMRGGFAPGQKISTRKLAAALGTSEMPVRAALTRLVAESGLRQNPNGTFSVPLLSRDRFREVSEMRSLLEGEATAAACGRIDAAGLAELQRCALMLEEAVGRRHIDDYLDANQRLKFSIYAYSPSVTLRSLIRLLWLQAGPFLRHLNQGLEDIALVNFHDDAIAALRAGDAAAACAAIRQDIEAGMGFLLQHASFLDEGNDNDGEDETR